METNFSVSPSACLSLLNTRRVCRAIAHPPPLVRLLMDTLEESVNSHRNASLDIFIITFFLLQLFRTMAQQPIAAPCQHWIFKRTRPLNPTDLKITAIFA